MAEIYQKVAYIALNQEDGSMLLNVPLYVKVNEVTKNGLSEMQEELIHRISEIMIHRYEKQINEYVASLKKEKKGGEENSQDVHERL